MEFKAEYMGLSDSLFTKGQVYEFDDDDLSISVTRLMKDFVIVEEDVNDVKTVFRVGDTVYYLNIGGYLCKGKVINIDYLSKHPIMVSHNDRNFYHFTLDGRQYDDVNVVKTLSFTPYDLVNGGLSQNREDIGKDLRVIKEDNSDVKIGDWDNYDRTNIVYRLNER